MDELCVRCLLVIRVLLSCEPHQPFLEQVNFERIKAGYECINSHIVLEPMDQVRVADVLRHHVTWLPLYFLLLADYFDAFATGGC